MGGSDPFQNQNFVTENHHSWNVLLLVKNILSSSIVEKKRPLKERDLSHAALAYTEPHQKWNSQQLCS